MAALLAACAAEPTTPSKDAVPETARWEGRNATVQVSLALPGRIAAQRESLGELAGVSVAALPLVPLVPDLAAGVVLALPFQAMFNLQAGLVTRTLSGRSLPALTLASIRRQWPDADGTPRVEIRLRIAGYGLVTRSGTPLTAFDTGKEPLCLVALAELERVTAGAPPAVERFDLGLSGRPPGAPELTCATLERMANPGSRWLARRIDELADTLAMLVVQRQATGDAVTPAK